MAATAVEWTRGLLQEMDIKGSTPKGPTTINADNQGAIKLVNNTQYQRRLKHIAIRYHYTRDLAEKEIVYLNFRPTKEMIADGLTEPLGATAFSRFVAMAGLTKAPEIASVLDRATHICF